MYKKYDSMYSQYKTIIDNLKKDNKTSLHKLIIDGLINSYSVRLCKKLGLIKQINKNNTLPQYKFKEVTEIEFNEIYCKVNKRKNIYVFDTENNIIDSHYEVKTLSKKYDINVATLRRNLQNEPMYKRNTFFSYDKNYTIPTEFVNKTVIAKNKTEYKPEYVDILKNNQALLIQKNPIIAEALGIHPRLLSTYCNKYPEFKLLWEYRKTLITKIRLEANNKKITKKKIAKKDIKADKIGGYSTTKQIKGDAEEILLIAKNQNKPVKRLGKFGSKDAIKERLKKI